MGFSLFRGGGKKLGGWLGRNNLTHVLFSKIDGLKMNGELLGISLTHGQNLNIVLLILKVYICEKYGLIVLRML